MIKYLIKKKMEPEINRCDKKMLMYAGLVAAGIGTGMYVTYKAINKCRCAKQECDELEYLHNEFYGQDNSDYNNKGHEEAKHNTNDAQHIDEHKDSHENEELREKIDEFNSNRINSDNEEHAEIGEIENTTKNIEDDKKNTKIDEKDYSKVEFDEYDQ